MSITTIIPKSAIDMLPKFGASTFLRKIPIFGHPSQWYG
jgi:hypothetical protein